MKRFIFLSLIIGMATVVRAQDVGTASYRFSLEDCLDYAFGNNYNLRTMKLTEEAKDDAYEQSKKERLPGLSASVNESLSNSESTSATVGGTYGISANMTLYQGGAITNTIEQNKLKVEQSGYQTSQYENGLVVQILQAFLTVLSNEEMLKYQQAVVEASEEQLKQGKDLFRVGSILESDYLMLEAQYANDQNNIVSTQIARDNGLLTLKSLLSIPAVAELEIIHPDTAAIAEMGVLPVVSEVIDRAMVSLPDLKINQYNVDLAKLSLKMSKGNYLPTVSLYGSVGTGHSTFDKLGTQLTDRMNEQIGLTVSIPIYDNSRTKSKVRQSRIALQQAELDMKQSELDIQQTVATEYHNVVAAQNKFRTTEVRQNAYSKTFDVYRAQFRAGSITAVDLLQQQNNYISALNDYIQSKYEFILRRKILDVYMGIQIKI